MVFMKLNINHPRKDYIKHNWKGVMYFITKRDWTEVPDDLAEHLKKDQPQSFDYKGEPKNDSVVESVEEAKLVEEDLPRHELHKLNRLQLMKQARDMGLKPKTTNSKIELLKMIKEKL